MSVLVTVVGPDGAADLELDDARPVGDLFQGLAATLGNPRAVGGLRTADGVHLSPDTTLADAGVLDGHRLTLVPALETSAGAPVLACYLAVDTSDSMAGPELEAVNVELSRLVDAVRDDARLADTCQLAVVTFDAEVRLQRPLTPVGDLGPAPRLAATRPATNYDIAFRFLRRQIAEDLDQLRSAGRRPLRPAVFLLTDGRPTRGHWPAAHAELTSPAWPDAPRVVAFGFGDAAALALRRIGTAGTHLPASAPGVPVGGPAGMLATVMTFLLNTLRVEPPGWPTPAGSPAEPGAARPSQPAAPAAWRSLGDLRR